MQVYTLKEAARQTKVGMETLKRSCEEGLIKAVKLPSGQWRIGEDALHKFINEVGGDLKRILPQLSRGKSKRPQPAGLKKYMESHKREKKAA